MDVAANPDNGAAVWTAAGGDDPDGNQLGTEDEHDPVGAIHVEATPGVGVPHEGSLESPADVPGAAVLGAHSAGGVKTVPVPPEYASQSVAK